MPERDISAKLTLTAKDWTRSRAGLKNLAGGTQAGFFGASFHWADVLMVAAWGLGGLILAARLFSVGSRGANRLDV